ncbi:alpha/beta fold hydrolase [Candidatus Neomarinimicrobiota bacterium]
MLGLITHLNDHRSTDELIARLNTASNWLSDRSCARYIRFLLVLSLCLHCTNDTTIRSTEIIPVDPTTTLEVVNWGGSGFPVVFLAGLGHTAHVFDEFAPNLTDRYHAIGITRRGFGASSQLDSGYEVQTLMEDIHIVLDSLNFERVVLVGHSLGGDEMTLFARKYPDMVAALVYIEAAYNRASSRDSLARYTAPQSETPLPSTADSASAVAFQAYYARANGVRMPLSEIEAMYLWSADGRFHGSVTPGWIYGRIVNSLHDPNYSNLDAPALAIYGIDYPITELFLDYDSRDSLTQTAMRTYHEANLRIAKYSQNYFRTNMSRAQVVAISGAGHSVYITHSSQVLEAIRTFLAEVL